MRGFAGRRGADEGLVLGVERQRAPVAAPPGHVLALVAVGVADHHDRHVGGAGRQPGGVEIVAGVVGDVDDQALAGRPEPVEQGHHARRPHVARPAVAGDGDRGQPSEHGQRLHPVGVEREHRRPARRRRSTPLVAVPAASTVSLRSSTIDRSATSRASARCSADATTAGE